ncbi:MAG: CoA-binding protein [Chloroflexi bacterium]|nr:MAG: CoA-binding protein [Chloroflexota bacterium]
MSEDKIIEKILKNSKTIAVVGFSSHPSRAGYYVPAYLYAQGYRIIPVNPYLHTEAFGEKPHPDLLSIREPVDLVLIFRRSEHVLPVVEEAIQIGARAVWMQLGIVNEEAAVLARNAGLDVVMNACMLVEHRNRSHVL